MPEETTRSGSHHPEEWRYDLNPAALTGAPTGQSDLQSEKATATAHDVKDVHRHLHGFTDDELKSIPVLPDGSRLQEGATYIDLQDPARREFTATGGMDASPAHYYVPKSEVDYVLWNRLIGVTDPARLDQAQ